jgi:4-amino-4-deoxy-L-arabinose transferase-like glycosyltransferase
VPVQRGAHSEGGDPSLAEAGQPADCRGCFARSVLGSARGHALPSCVKRPCAHRVAADCKVRTLRYASAVDSPETSDRPGQTPTSEDPAIAELAAPSVTGTAVRGVPVTDVPSADVPTTDVPSADVPTTDVPSADVPSADVPSTDVPSTDVPTTNVPVRQTENPAIGRRRRARSPRTPLRWLVGLWAALLVGASLLWPVSYGYDELQHFDMTYQYAQHPTTFYAPGALHLSNAAVAIQKLVPPNPNVGPFATAPIAARADRPTLKQLGGANTSPAAAVDQMVQHPPLYYWLGAVVLDLPGVSHLAWDQQFWLVRLVSVLLMLPVPLLCFGAARRLARRFKVDERTVPTRGDSTDGFSGTENAIGLIAAAVPLTIPNLIRDGAAVTNDSLLISATSFFCYFLIRICFGELSKKVVAGASVALLVALLTKGFALVLPPILIVGLVIGWRRNRREGANPLTRRQLTEIAAIVVGCLVVGSLWWLRNLIRFSAIQVNGFGPHSDDVRYGPADNAGTLAHFIPDFLSQTMGRTWGGFGLADYPSGSAVSVWGWPVLVGVGLLAALQVKRHRGVTVLLLIGVLLTFGVVAENAWGLYKTHSRIGVQGAQGRYVYHTIVVLAAVAAVGWASVLRRRTTNLLAYGVLLLAILTNASAWFMIVDTWYAGGRAPLLRKIRDGIHGVVRWSPVPKPFTLAVFAVVVVTAVLSWLQVRRYCRSLLTNAGDDSPGLGTPSHPEAHPAVRTAAE